MMAIPEWAPSLAFVAFLFAMFYWMVSRMDKVRDAMLSVLNKLAAELHAHQIKDAELFAALTVKQKPNRRAKRK